MVGSVGLESFVAAIACLCASSFGPPITNSSNEHLENTKLSNMDLTVLQLFVNSKSKFTIESQTDNDCVLPSSENISERLKSLENDMEVQRQVSQRLKKKLKSLSAEIESKDAEIKMLQERNNSVQSVSKNLCLQKDGFVEISPFKIFCDQKLDTKYGRGWMLIAQRFNGKEHFFQTWDNYIKGFGSIKASAEFFIGLEILSGLTNKYSNELLILLTDRDNVVRYALYDLFVIGSEKEKFALKSLGSFSGDAGDSLRYHVGQKFSTWDKDNDESSANCASKHSGAWWYKDCHESNLFGIYESKRLNSSKHLRNGMIWSGFHDTDGGYLSSMRMYVRSKED